MKKYTIESAEAKHTIRRKGISEAIKFKNSLDRFQNWIIKEK